MATAGSRWGVVMSRNAGFSDQVRILEPDNYMSHILLFLIAPQLPVFLNVCLLFFCVMVEF